MKKLLKPVWVLLAIVFLVEAWLWEHLGPLVRRIVDFVPWARLKAALVALVDRLPPVATLIVFAVPAGLMFPIKLAALWLIAKGHFVLGVACFGLVKVVGVGVTAFLFEITKPKLMLIPGFPWLYETVLALRDWAHRQTDPIKLKLKAMVARWRAEARPGVLAFLARVRRRVQSHPR